MQQKNFQISFEEYNNIDQLNAQDKELLQKAIQVSKSAYAKYSDFHVGAAILLDNGVTITGNNQENAAYPSGLCAERVAIFYAGAQHPHVKIKSIAVAAFAGNNTTPQAASPCGACRQVMSEYENIHKNNIRFIMFYEENKIIIAHSIKSLLPFTFSSDNLITTKP